MAQYVPGVGVISVTNSDGTITVSPNNGQVVASIALNHANTWSALQIFDSSDIAIMNPAATHYYTIAGAAIGGSYVLTLPLITGADTIAALATAQTWTATQTYGSQLLVATNPKFATSIQDVNGNAIITLNPTTSAVDSVQITNAATAGHIVAVSAVGTDTDISLNLVSKGAGTVNVNGSAITIPNVVEKSNASESLLSTTNATTITTFTPGSQGNFMVLVYYRVITASTTLTLSVTWTDGTGAQTNTIINGISQPVNSYSGLPLYINATAAAITVSATAGTANQVYCSASILQIT